MFEMNTCNVTFGTDTVKMSIDRTVNYSGQNTKHCPNIKYILTVTLSLGFHLSYLSENGDFVVC